MAERPPFGEHEEDPDEFADWDAHERARAGRVRGSGIVVPTPGRARTVIPDWRSTMVERPDEVEFPAGPEVIVPDQKYL